MVFHPAISLTEQIADHLGQQIITGQLQPAERIQELRVAAALGVSRGSVREALLILESRHLVEIVPRRGAMVSRLEAAEICNFSELYADLLNLFFSKIAAQSSAVPTRSGAFTRLAAAVAEITEAIAMSDVERVLGGQRDFVAAGLDALDNYYLVAVLRGLIPAASRLAHLAACHADFDARDTLRYHQALFAAIDQGDAPRVSELVSAHGRREARLASESLGLKNFSDASAGLSRGVA
jgi:DNA-binding GntR family transcriptional regulator